MNRKRRYYLIPAFGTIFCLWYVFAATSDGIYSDYVRLVNSYLSNVWDPARFFTPDILTRIPINYLGRIINVSWFGYNLMFDRVLGVLALGLSGGVLTAYCIRKKISFGWLLVLMMVFFSLNKWEMLTNGSGWAHFLAFAFFYYHYEVIDRVYTGEVRPHDRWKLYVLPFVTTLFIAGPYCAIYSVTVILACAGIFFLRKKESNRDFIRYGICSLSALVLYLGSNSFAVEDHAAPATVSLFTQLKDTPGFFARFIIKSFSSMVIGGERAEEIFSTNTPFLILGLAVMVLYALALWLQWRYKVYETTLFPLILLVSGGLNHVLIVLSRWIFLRDNYGISSRYALQYQIGILGILLTFSLVLKQQKKKVGSDWPLRLAAGAACALFLTGNVYTTYTEIKKAPLRKNLFEKRAELSLHFEELTDEELPKEFEYRPSRADSGEKVRSALTILKENGYSVFHNSKEKER
nr:hypothetical protein [Clostridium sp. E02]